MDTKLVPGPPPCRLRNQRVAPGAVAPCGAGCLILGTMGAGARSSPTTSARRTPGSRPSASTPSSPPPALAACPAGRDLPGHWPLLVGRDAGPRRGHRRDRAARRRARPAHSVWPDPWPSNGLQAMRAAVHAHAIGRGPRLRPRGVQVHFSEGVTLTTRRACGLRRTEPGWTPTSDRSDRRSRVKARLRENTERALALGVAVTDPCARR